LGLDAAGRCVGLVEADPAGADAPGDATDDDGSGFVVAGVDADVDDPALACAALTEVVTGAEGPPECDAMQAVLARASAATPQPVATARRTLTLEARKVSMAQILARPQRDAQPRRPHRQARCPDCEHADKPIRLASL
jgi:hypothetical protein